MLFAARFQVFDLDFLLEGEKLELIGNYRLESLPELGVSLDRLGILGEEFSQIKFVLVFFPEFLEPPPVEEKNRDAVDNEDYKHIHDEKGLLFKLKIFTQSSHRDRENS